MTLTFKFKHTLRTGRSTIKRFYFPFQKANYPSSVNSVLINFYPYLLLPEAQNLFSSAKLTDVFIFNF